MNELQEQVWIEKYRPQTFEDLILNDKVLIIKYINQPKSIPSFIFYSSKPGTGKTSTAKIIIKELNCDSSMINSSDERGIDTIREKIKLFSRSLSSDINIKRCVFLDEADGLTRQAQDSLRNLMETYSNNVFFIFSCNDFNKLIEPIRSRCQVINFERPNKADIQARLEEICEKEDILNIDIEKLINAYYPDIRSMIKKLQELKIDNKSLIYDEIEFDKFLNDIKSKDVKKIYEKVYSGDFEIMGFNKWFWNKLFEEYDNNKFHQTREIALRLADIEKSWNIGANLEIVFISNILKIMEVLK